MGKIENLKKQIQELSDEELARLRQWFADYDAAKWDLQIEADAKAGKLDRLAEKALRDHAEGRTKPL